MEKPSRTLWFYSFWFLLASSIGISTMYFAVYSLYQPYYDYRVAISVGIVFTIFTLARRRFLLSKIDFPRLISIALSDYSFRNYLTINICSALYAVSQGAALGIFVQQLATLLCMPIAILHPIASPINFFSEFFILLASILFIFVVRLALEGYIVIFSAAQKIQQFVDYKVVEPGRETFKT